MQNKLRLMRSKSLLVNLRIDNRTSCKLIRIEYKGNMKSYTEKDRKSISIGFAIVLNLKIEMLLIINLDFLF